MNERINDLMYRAGLTAQGCWDETDDYDREAILKFAELIVRECNQAVLEVPCYYKDYMAKIEEAVINDCARAVLEHFGVEK